MSFSFGATTAASTTPSFSFGSSTPATGGLNFGSTPTGTTGLQFNAPTTTQPTTGLSFGTPTTTPNFSFGGSSAGSLSFGTPTTTTTTSTGLGLKPPTGGLSFGTTPQTSLSLGTPASGLSFGTTPQTPSTNAQTPLNFGITPALTTPTTTSTTGSLSFGTTPAFGTTKPTLSFGSTTTTTTAPSTGLFSFSPAKTTAPASFGFTTTGTSGTGTGLFGTPTPTTTAPSSTPFKGLGGVDTTQSLSGSQSEKKCGKDNAVPNEIMQTIESFKNFVKQQKNLAAEVSRASGKPLKKVTEDTEAMRQLLSSISSTQQKNRIVINKLKTDTSKCLVQCEMAQRTQDTPIGLQNDNNGPLEFFISLVSKFERDVQDLRQEIDNTEKHVKSLTQPTALTPQELTIALKRLHDSFIALAGRLQTVHTQVRAQKDQHLSIRRHFIKDTSNIFETSTRKEILPKKATIQAMTLQGPTPFSSIGRVHPMNMLSLPDTSISFQSNTLLSGWNTNPAAPNVISGTQISVLQSPGTPLGSSTATENQNFQLLKPPLGNKRGKR